MQDFVFHDRAYKEVHGIARNPHGIYKILYSGSTRVMYSLYRVFKRNLRLNETNGLCYWFQLNRVRKITNGFFDVINAL